MSGCFRKIWLAILGILLLPFSAKDLWAAVGGGGGITGEVFWQLISFVLILILLINLLKKPVRAFLTKRQEGIKSTLEQASKKEEESGIYFEEWEKKLNLLTQEVTELQQKITREGEAERKRIIERAKDEGDRIIKQAQLVAEQEVKKGRAVLKKEMVDLSVELAENLLKEAAQPRDQERLVKDYIEKVRELR